MKLWTVWYGTTFWGTDKDCAVREATKPKWRAREETAWNGELDYISARGSVNSIIREGHATQAFVVEAPTRYQAIKIAKLEDLSGGVKILCQ